MSGKNKKLTANLLREFLQYNPKTGIFNWRKTPVNQVNAGDEAGWLEAKGYRRICVDGGRYLAHRLAWLYMTGEWPNDQIDHINMLKDDNRWSNLRSANNSQNQGNTFKRNHNTSGHKGVYWHKRKQSWHASISINSRLKFLGYCKTKKEAADLYAAAAKEYFGEFARAS